jgi:hypothetical protein
MALDLSVRSREQMPDMTTIKQQCHESTDGDENEDTNNNTVTAVNLSKPKSSSTSPDQLLLEKLQEEMDAVGRLQEGRSGSGAVSPAADTMLTSQQLQLDIAALNLICLARLQETAAVLAGRRPLPAHLNSSSLLVTTSSSSSSPLNRRTHRCDEPGCDKVIIFF